MKKPICKYVQVNPMAGAMYYMCLCSTHLLVVHHVRHQNIVRLELQHILRNSLPPGRRKKKKRFSGHFSYRRIARLCKCAKMWVQCNWAGGSCSYNSCQNSFCSKIDIHCSLSTAFRLLTYLSVVSPTAHSTSRTLAWLKSKLNHFTPYKASNDL